jgi:hypothetical protein
MNDAFVGPRSPNTPARGGARRTISERLTRYCWWSARSIRGSESPGSAVKSQEETEYQHSVPVSEDGVEAALRGALRALWNGDFEGARREAERALDLLSKPNT